MGIAFGNLNTRHAALERLFTRRMDPELLATEHDRLAFARLAGIEPDPWQAEVLASDDPRISLNCTRQGGKSTVTSVIAAHTAIFEPNSLTLMVSATERQSGELFRKALAVYRNVGRPIPALRESALQLELANHSRIVALPGKEGSIRSFSSVSLLLIDEASRVPDEAYMSVRPMLAVSGGRLVTLSTCFGTRGWWYEAWRGPNATYDVNQGPPPDGIDEWRRWEIPATACPRITPEFLEEERRNMGAWWFSQEYECKFLDAKSAAFRQADIDRAFSENYETWDLDPLGTGNTAIEEDPDEMSFDAIARRDWGLGAANG